MIEVDMTALISLFDSLTLSSKILLTLMICVAFQFKAKQER